MAMGRLTQVLRKGMTSAPEPGAVTTRTSCFFWKKKEKKREREKGLSFFPFRWSFARGGCENFARGGFLFFASSYLAMARDSLLRFRERLDAFFSPSVSSASMEGIDMVAPRIVIERIRGKESERESERNREDKRHQKTRALVLFLSPFSLSLSLVRFAICLFSLPSEPPFASPFV